MENQVLVEANQPVELGSRIRTRRHFEKERGREAIGGGHDGVVDRKLLGDLLVCREVLGAEHFLNLGDEGVTVFKHHGDAIADDDTPIALEFDDALAVVVAHSRVDCRALDVRAFDGCR